MASAAPRACIVVLASAPDIPIFFISARRCIALLTSGSPAIAIIACTCLDIFFTVFFICSGSIFPTSDIIPALLAISKIFI